MDPTTPGAMGGTPPPATAPPAETPPAGAPTPAAPVPAWHEGIITKGADGNESLADPASWLDKAPAPLGKFIKDQMTAARAKTEGQLKVPGPDDPPEAWEPVWKAVGRPDKPEGYGITKPEKLPDGIAWNDDRTKRFAEAAHKAGAPKSVVDAVMNFYSAEMAADADGLMAAGEKMIAEERVALDKAFGPKLAEAAGNAQAFLKSQGLDPDLMNPVAGQFAGAPMLKVIATLQAELAKHTSEGSFGTPPGGNSPTSHGKAYAEAVMARKHPDSAKYYGDEKAGVKPDLAFQLRIGEEFRKG